MRHCPNDSGTVSGRSAATNAGGVAGRCPRLPGRRRPATWPTARPWGSRRGYGCASSRSRAARILAIRRMASRESPPSSKKDCSAPTRSSPSTSANSPHSTSSIGVAGPRPPTGAGELGSGQRPAVQLPVRRQRQGIEHHHRRRDHVLGQPLRHELPQHRAVDVESPGVPGRRRPPGGARPDGPHGRPPPPGRPPRGPASTASISPGSTRKPRIFTCSSARPPNTSCTVRGPPRQVAGAVHPLARTGRRGRRRTARPSTPHDPDSPAPARHRPHTAHRATPAGTGRRNPSSTNTRMLAIGRPIGTGPSDRKIRQRLAQGRAHCRLGRPIGVDHPPPGHRPTRHQFRRAPPHPRPRSSPGSRQLVHHRQHGWRKRHMGDAVLAPPSLGQGADVSRGPAPRPSSSVQHSSQTDASNPSEANCSTRATGSDTEPHTDLAAERPANPACDDHHALRPPRRPGGVDHIRHVPDGEPARPVSIHRRLNRASPQRRHHRRIVHHQPLEPTPHRQHTHRRRRTHHQPRPRIPQHERNPLRRILRIHRNKPRPRLRHTQQHRHQLRRPPQHHPHHSAGTHTPRQQLPRHPISRRIQLRERPLTTTPHHRNTRRRPQPPAPRTTPEESQRAPPAHPPPCRSNPTPTTHAQPRTPPPTARPQPPDPPPPAPTPAPTAPPTIGRCPRRTGRAGSPDAVPTRRPGDDQGQRVVGGVLAAPSR